MTPQESAGGAAMRIAAVVTLVAALLSFYALFAPRCVGVEPLRVGGVLMYGCEGRR